MIWWIIGVICTLLMSFAVFSAIYVSGQISREEEETRADTERLN